MLNRADYLITYDRELGVIYAPKKKAIKTTTSMHAQAIKECLDSYFLNDMSQEDREMLEGYLAHSFENDPDLPVMEYPDLMSTNRIRRLEIMVANECNLNCQYCYANGGNYGEISQRMTPAMAAAYLDAFLDDRYDKVDVVMFFGGEPTLCPDTINAVCNFFNEGVTSGRFKKLPDYTMVSNGTLIDEYMAKIIAQNKIRITISIDGPREINDVLRVDKGGNGTFCRIENGIQELKKQNYAPSMIEATYTAKHQEGGYDKPTIRKYLREKFDVEDIMVANCEDDGTHAFNPTGDIVDEEAIRENIFSNQTQVHKVMSAHKFVDLNCDAGLASVALFPNGEVYPCHRFIVNKDYRIAQYKNGQFNFSNYSRVKKKICLAQRLQNPECNRCDINSLCRRCPFSMLLTEGVDHNNRFCQEEIKCEHKAVLNYAKQLLQNQKATIMGIQE